jgi:hypothetical protein
VLVQMLVVVVALCLAWVLRAAKGVIPGVPAKLQLCTEPVAVAVAVELKVHTLLVVLVALAKLALLFLSGNRKIKWKNNI